MIWNLTYLLVNIYWSWGSFSWFGYLERTTAGDRQTGYCHINGHHPELTFLPHGQENEQTSWMVKRIEENTLVMTNLSEENGEIIKTFTRLSSFPE